MHQFFFGWLTLAATSCHGQLTPAQQEVGVPVFKFRSAVNVGFLMCHKVIDTARRESINASKRAEEELVAPWLLLRPKNACNAIVGNAVWAPRDIHYHVEFGFDVSHLARPWQSEAAFASTSFRWELKLQGAGGRRLASLSSAELLEKLKAGDSADLPKNNQENVTLLQ